MRKRIFIILISCIVLITACLFLFIDRVDNSGDGDDMTNPNMEDNSNTEIDTDGDNKVVDNVIGVWWWNDELDEEEYLSFASANNVNEIYFCSCDFGADTSNFISRANKLGIEVYWLQGEYEWLDDSISLMEKIEDYRQYQEDYPDSKFSGIHLDIEPHQSPDFDARRESLILKLIKLADLLKQTYKEISFDFDIPFWIDDNITYGGSTRSAYQHMIDIADRVFVMSYRDTADAIIDVGGDELSYAKEVGKKIIFSVECSSSEGDKVSFAEEGRCAMMAELEILKQKLGDDFRISIHNIKSWHDMKE